MELKRFIQVAIAKKWIVLATFAVTLAAVFFLTANQTPMYESVGKYAVRPILAEEDTKSLWTALEILGRSHIQTTMAEVANSNRVKRQAGDALGLRTQQLRDLSVNSRPLAGTNVILIAVEGPDPAVARGFVLAIGAETATALQSLYGAFELHLFDEPNLPSSPTKPRVTFNLLLGAVAGLVLGIGLAFLAAYLETPLGESAPTPAATGDRPAKAPAWSSVVGQRLQHFRFAYERRAGRDWRPQSFFGKGSRDFDGGQGASHSERPPSI